MQINFRIGEGHCTKIFIQNRSGKITETTNPNDKKTEKKPEKSYKSQVVLNVM